MNAVSAIALSGSHAATHRVAVAAGNIVNARTTGPVNPAEARQASETYQRQRVHLTSLASGGVQSHTVIPEPSTEPMFAPSDPNANADGVVQAPKVDLAAEFVEVMSAEIAYRASLKLLEADQQMFDALLDTRS